MSDHDEFEDSTEDLRGGQFGRHNNRQQFDDDEFGEFGRNDFGDPLTRSQVLHNQRADEAVDLSDHSMEGSVNSAELSQHLQHTHADSDSPASHSQYNRKVASPMAMPPSASAARQQHDAFAHDDEFQGNEFQGNEFGGNEFNNDQFRGQEFDHGTYGNDEQRWQGDSDEDMVPAMGGDVHIGGSGPTGLYNPDEFHNLNASVAPEIRDLFDYIGRYKAHDIELEAKLKPFIPDYIPAIGEIDSFVKVPRPDDKTDTLGLQVLDEPASRQSDPTSLDLFLRLHAKQAHLTPVAVRSIEFADKNPKKVAAWISNVQDVHRQKPPPTVHYSKPMPEIEQLMQVWPQDFEEALKEIPLPPPDLNVSLADYAKICCALLDIPVHGNVIESLHVMFSLYTEFKDTQQYTGAQ